MANTEINILKAIQAIIQNASGAGNAMPYLNPSLVFLGLRDNVPTAALPAVYIEPRHTREELARLPRGFNLTVEVMIEIVMECSNYDSQLVGDTQANVRGLMDVVDDIKNALDAFPDLNYDGTTQRVNYFRFPETSYTPELYPVRIADILFQGHFLTPGGSR